MCAKFYRNRTFNFKVMIKKPISDEKIRISLSEIQNWFFDHNFKIKCPIPIKFRTHNYEKTINVSSCKSTQINNVI